MLRRIDRRGDWRVARSLWLVAGVVAILLGCRVGTPVEDPECAPIREELAGTWRSGCLFLEVRQNDDNEDENIFFRDTLTFNGNDFTREYREFAEGDCALAGERLVVFADGGYEVSDDFGASSDGLDVCEMDFVYDEVVEEVDRDDVFEAPDTPFEVFDIVYLLPEPDENDTERRTLFLGDLEGPFIENTKEDRPVALNFEIVYER